MSSPNKVNPFSMTYDALWQMAASHPEFNRLVKIGNRIRYDDSRDPEKQVVAAADLPEVVLVSESLSTNLHATSSSSMMTRNYTWLISTGDLRMNELLYPVEWALICAMANWKQVLGALKWKGAHFIKQHDMTAASEGESDSTRNRGIIGWSSSWRCTVQMYFKTNDLIGELSDGSS